jgi:hypothetical protein
MATVKTYHLIADGYTMNNRTTHMVALGTNHDGEPERAECVCYVYGASDFQRALECVHSHLCALDDGTADESTIGDNLEIGEQ